MWPTGNDAKRTAAEEELEDALEAHREASSSEASSILSREAVESLCRRAAD